MIPLMDEPLYWWLAIGIYVVWVLGVAVWLGIRLAGPKASPRPFWALEDYHYCRYDRIRDPRGDGWPMVWGLLLGLPFAALWIGMVPLGVLGLAFVFLMLIAKSGYLARVRRAQAKVAVLNERAKEWDRIAGEDAQIPATRDAARAAAASLREQAKAMRVPPTAKGAKK